MTYIAQQNPDELPTPQPPETPPLEPDRVSEPGAPETPPPQPAQPEERPPEYPTPDTLSS